jgi:pimeloyl-ACP methyl ester carboxylesterase
MPKVEVKDIEMYYEIYGDGEAVVFLHGFSATNQMWEPFIPEFREHFRLIVPDMRGHGRSTNPSGEFTHRQSALDVYALLDHLGVERFRAVGYSSGGMTLLHMATQQPGRVTDLVLISATPFFPEECREAFIVAMDEEHKDDWGERAHLHQHGVEQIEQLRMQFHRWKDSYDDMNFTPPYLSTIEARTLIVHGDRDLFFPVSIPVTMYDSIPDSYLWVIPNMGHGVAWPPAEGLISTTFDFMRRDWRPP